MIQNYSNLTLRPYIELSTTLVRSSGTILDGNNVPIFLNVRGGDYLLITLNCSGAGGDELTKELFMYLSVQNIPPNTLLKIAALEKHTSISGVSITPTLIEDLISQSNTYDRMMLNKDGTENINENIKIDLHTLLEYHPEVNPTITFVLFFEKRLSLLSLNIQNPQYLADENIEVCVATTAEAGGLCSIFASDEHSMGECGKINVNLYTGDPIYSLDILSGVKTQFPIGFGICHNPSVFADDFPHLRNKIMPTFRYRLNMRGKSFILQDPTGAVYYYQKLIFEESSKAKTCENYGIKHLDTPGNIYRCSFNGSYIFVNRINIDPDEVITDPDTLSLSYEYEITHYDKSDTRTCFYVKGYDARILSMTTRRGKGATYHWEGNKLDSITNSDNEIMKITYDTSGYIDRVSFPGSYRYAEFIYTLLNAEKKTSTIAVKVHDTYSENGESSDNIVKHVELEFTNYYLKKVTNMFTGEYLTVNYAGLNQTGSVGVYSADGTEIKSLTSYTYGLHSTTATDIEGHYKIYSYDAFGRVLNIKDDKNRVVCREYVSSSSNEPYRLSGNSKVQTHSKNLLQNHSFEEEINTGDIANWQKSGFVNSSTKIRDGGVIGGKCLQVEASSSECCKLYQEVNEQFITKFALKGFIKHEQLTGEEAEKIKIGVTYSYTLDGVSTTESKYASLNTTESDWYSFTSETTEIPDGAVIDTITAEITADHIDTTFFVDDLQLSDATYAVRYNYVTNGYMEFTESELPKSWNYTNLGENDKMIQTESTSDHSSMLGDKVMRFSSISFSEFDSDRVAPVKKMYQTVYSSGVKGELFVFSAYAMGNVSNNVIFRAFVQFGDSDRKHYLDFQRHAEYWQIIYGGIIADKSFDYITLGIEYNGCSEVLIDCIQFYKDSFGRYYNYDNLGNITEIIDSNGLPSITVYNESGMPTEIYSSDGSFHRYEYGEEGTAFDGLLLKVTDLNGNTVEFEYDSKDRVTKTTITPNGEDNIVTTTAYDDTQDTITITDEYGKITVLQKDYLGRIKERTNPLGITSGYTFDAKSRITAMNVDIGNPGYQASITYDDSKDCISAISGSGGVNYAFASDTFGRVTNVQLNQKVLERYTYDSLVDGYRKGLITSKSFGPSARGYSFQYNDNDKIKIMTVGTQRVSMYTYDDDENVYLYQDAAHAKNYFRTYDSRGNLTKEFSIGGGSKLYSYDNLGNIQKVAYITGENSRSIDFEHNYEYNEYTKEGFISRLANTFGDEVILGSNNSKGLYGASPILSTQGNTFDNDINMKVFKFTNNSELLYYPVNTFNSSRATGVVFGNAYSYGDWSKMLNEHKTFYAFIKPTGQLSSLNLFELCADTTAGYCSVKGIVAFDAQGRLYHKSNADNTITSTTGNLVIDRWNLVGVKVSNNYVSLVLNNECTTPCEIDYQVNAINYILICDQSSAQADKPTDGTLPTGHPSEGDESLLAMSVDIALMSFGSYDYTDDDFKAIYSEADKYIFKNGQTTAQKSQSYASPASSTIYYSKSYYDGFDVISLCGSLESSSGISPLKSGFTDSSYKLDKLKLFKYDKSSKHHTFASFTKNNTLTQAYNPVLGYLIPFSTTGTISVRFKCESSSTERTIYQVISNSGSELLRIFFAAGSNYLSVAINGNIKATSIQVSYTNWHQLVLQTTSNALAILVDGATSTGYAENNVSVDFTNTKIYIGSKQDGSTRLEGCMEMLAFKADIAGSSFLTKPELSAPIMVRKNLDKLGKVKNRSYSYGDTSKYVFYDYDLNRITSEAHKNNHSRSYTYDDNGNITRIRIIDGAIQSNNVVIVYDDLGQLKKYRDTNEQNKYEEWNYTCDNSGNIRAINHRNPDGTTSTLIYTYDNYNRLTAINKSSTDNIQTITYNSSYVFFPATMKIGGETRTLNWRADRLMSISGIAGFIYSANGMRILKTTDNAVTQYEVDGDKVISATTVADGVSTVLNFIYDASGELIGLSTDLDEYFYAKDILGNIIGIINKNGVFVVKYKYDPWGAILSSDVLYTADPALALNPFRYKGYVYDEETGWYYLKSRYYDPSIGRFISPDDSSYINPTIHNGLNLYTYCYNNPVMYADANGNFPVLAIVGTAILAVAAAIVTAVQIDALNKSKEAISEHEDVKAMDKTEVDAINETQTKHGETGDTTGLSLEEQIAYIRYYKENNSVIGANWTEEQMLRELWYHEEMYNFSVEQGWNNDLLKRLIKVDFEEKQNLNTYMRRFIGNFFILGV